MAVARAAGTMPVSAWKSAIVPSTAAPGANAGQRRLTSAPSIQSNGTSAAARLAV